MCWQWYTCRGQRPSERELARYIGVSHTHVQNLRKEFSTGSVPTDLPRLTFHQALEKLKEEQIGIERLTYDVRRQFKAAYIMGAFYWNF